MFERKILTIFFGLVRLLYNNFYIIELSFPKWVPFWYSMLRLEWPTFLVSLRGTAALALEISSPSITFLVFVKHSFIPFLSLLYLLYVFLGSIKQIEHFSFLSVPLLRREEISWVQDSWQLSVLSCTLTVLIPAFANVLKI